MQSIQEAFSAQRAQDWEAIQRSNKVMLIVAGTFAGIGFLTLLIMTWFQWRMSKGLAEISAALPVGTGVGRQFRCGRAGPGQPTGIAFVWSG